MVERVQNLLRPATHVGGHSRQAQRVLRSPTRCRRCRSLRRRHIRVYRLSCRAEALSAPGARRSLRVLSEQEPADKPKQRSCQEDRHENQQLRCEAGPSIPRVAAPDTLNRSDSPFLHLNPPRVDENSDPRAEGGRARRRFLWQSRCMPAPMPTALANTPFPPLRFPNLFPVSG